MLREMPKINESSRGENVKGVLIFMQPCFINISSMIFLLRDIHRFFEKFKYNLIRLREILETFFNSVTCDGSVM